MRMSAPRAEAGTVLPGARPTYAAPKCFEDGLIERLTFRILGGSAVT
jgi:hypothetical protein